MVARDPYYNEVQREEWSTSLTEEEHYQNIVERTEKYIEIEEEINPYYNAVSDEVYLVYAFDDNPEFFLVELTFEHINTFEKKYSPEQLLMRIYAYQAGVDLSKIRSGKLNSDELLLLSLAKEDLSKQNLYFDVSPSSNIADIRTKCRQLKQAGKLDFIVIDYLQLITTENSRGNRQEEVSKISRQLKTLAQELQVPILALSQLSRNLEGRENKTPQLADLRESGSIEQDADIVFFIYRRSDVEEQDVADQLNEKLKEEQLQKEQKSKKVMLEVIVSIAKNRQGPLQDFDYHFYGHLCRFTEQREFRKPVGKRRRAQGMRRLNGNNND